MSSFSKLNPIKTVQRTSLSNLVGCRPVTIRNSSPGKSMSPLWAQSKWNLESLGVPSRFAGLPGKSPGLCSTMFYPKKSFPRGQLLCKNHWMHQWVCEGNVRVVSRCHETAQQLNSTGEQQQSLPFLSGSVSRFSARQSVASWNWRPVQEFDWQP